MKRLTMIGAVTGMALAAAGTSLGAEIVASTGTYQLSFGDQLANYVTTDRATIQSTWWHPTQPWRRYKASLFPQNSNLTGDNDPTEATFAETADDASHVELMRGWVYAEAFEETGEAARSSQKAPTGTGEARALISSYPIVIIRSIDAGAEGTELLVTLAQSPVEEDQMIVYVMFMGSASTDSSVWSQVHATIGTDPDPVDEIPYTQRDKLFIAIGVENYGTANEKYKWHRRMPYGGSPKYPPGDLAICAQARHIHDCVEDLVDTQNIWTPGPMPESCQ